MRSGTQPRSSVAADSGERSDADPSRWWRTRRTLLTGALILGAVAGLLALALWLTVRNFQEDLSRGRLAMERGRNQLMAGDATAASESFREGRELFARAEDRGNGLVLRPANPVRRMADPGAGIFASDRSGRGLIQNA